MKFFLVIPIVAFWWVPLNSPGNIGIPSFGYSTKLVKPKIEPINPINENMDTITKRKIDHFGYQIRKQLLK